MTFSDTQTQFLSRLNATSDWTSVENTLFEEGVFFFNSMVVEVCMNMINFIEIMPHTRKQILDQLAKDNKNFKN